MSSYIDFWACKGETSILIQWGTRSSELYQLFSYSVPYGSNKMLTKTDIDEYTSDVNDKIREFEDLVSKSKDKIEFLKESKLPVSELINQFEESQNFIEYCESQIKTYEYIKWFCVTALDIIDGSDVEIWVGIDSAPPYSKSSDDEQE